jgi:hypothetical protein
MYPKVKPKTWADLFATHPEPSCREIYEEKYLNGTQPATLESSGNNRDQDSGPEIDGSQDESRNSQSHVKQDGDGSDRIPSPPGPPNIQSSMLLLFYSSCLRLL